MVVRFYVILPVPDKDHLKNANPDPGTQKSNTDPTGSGSATQLFSGSSMMNAMSLKEKRDFLSTISVKPSKPKGDRKRKSNDDYLNQLKKKSSYNSVQPITAFDNMWEMRKVGDRYVTLPRDPGLVDQLRLTAFGSDRIGSVVISRNNTVNGPSSPTNGHQAAVTTKRKTYNRVSKARPPPPSTVTDMLATARHIIPQPPTRDISLDPDDPFTGGELRIDLSPELSEFDGSTVSMEPNGTTYQIPGRTVSAEDVDEDVVYPAGTGAYIFQKKISFPPINDFFNNDNIRKSI